MGEIDEKQMIEKVFPKSLWPLIVKTFLDAYSQSELLKSKLYWLNMPNAKSAVGFIRLVLVETRLNEVFSANTELNLKCKFIPNSTKNNFHLEIYSKDSVTTVCKVKGKRKVPSKAKYRLLLTSNNGIQPSKQKPTD